MNIAQIFAIIASIELLRRQAQQTKDPAERILLAGKIAEQLEELRKLQQGASKPDTADIMAALQRFDVETDPVKKVT